MNLIQVYKNTLTELEWRTINEKGMDLMERTSKSGKHHRRRADGAD